MPHYFAAVGKSVRHSFIKQVKLSNTFATYTSKYFNLYAITPNKIWQ